jgi:2-polyprenyl-6-methoxyphenol hydroxylase-like FAD-dependent oxidoreductase
MKLKESKVAIIGGGVSGILSALEFQKRNYEVDLYDPELLQGNAGFGFLLMPNGVAGLKSLGYWDKVVPFCTPTNSVITQNVSGEILTQKEVSDVYGISRVQFLQSLSPNMGEYIHCASSMVILNKEKNLTIENNPFPTDKYKWIIGCDVVNSQVRRKLFPDAELLDAPTYEINGSFEDENFTAQHAGNLYKIIFDELGLAFGILPLTSGQVIWYLQLAAQKFPIPKRENLAEFVKSTIAQYQHPWIQKIVQHHLSNLYLWKGRILLGVDQYVKDQYILLGDAAHVVLPFTSQGTNLAIDDIVSLVHCLDQNNTPEEVAFNHFNNRRESCERIAFEGMEYTHLFSHNESEFMLQYVPLAF